MILESFKKDNWIYPFLFKILLTLLLVYAIINYQNKKGVII